MSVVPAAAAVERNSRREMPFEWNDVGVFILDEWLTDIMNRNALGSVGKGNAIGDGRGHFGDIGDLQHTEVIRALQV